VPDRERKRQQRHKRKARGGGRQAEIPAAQQRTASSAAATGIGRDAAEPEAQDPIARGYARAEERNREAREALKPLREGERPTVVTIGAVISAAIAVSIAVGYASGVKVNGGQPKLVQALSPALLMAIMAWGMWRARYWAVLGFQTILLFLIFAAAFGLATRAASAAQIAADLGLLFVAGGFFFFMVKAMARIQMPHRLPRE